MIEAKDGAGGSAAGPAGAAPLDTATPPRDRPPFAEGACSGELASLAHALAERLAVAAEADGEPAPAAGDDRAWLAELEERLARFRAAAFDADRTAREIEAHRLEWTRVRGETLTLA